MSGSQLFCWNKCSNVPKLISSTSVFFSMTAPIIPPSALKVGETDLQVSGFSLSHLLPDIINYGVSWNYTKAVSLLFVFMYSIFQEILCGLL